MFYWTWILQSALFAVHLGDFSVSSGEMWLSMSSTG